MKPNGRKIFGGVDSRGTSTEVNGFVACIQGSKGAWLVSSGYDSYFLQPVWELTKHGFKGYLIAPNELCEWRS